MGEEHYSKTKSCTMALDLNCSKDCDSRTTALDTTDASIDTLIISRSRCSCLWCHVPHHRRSAWCGLVQTSASIPRSTYFAWCTVY